MDKPSNIEALPAPVSSSFTSGEMKIRLQPEYSRTEYVGTRAQLESEGLILDGIEFPLGIAICRWQDGGFNFRLKRIRPEDFKGPRRAWFECDNFELTREWIDFPDWQERELRAKAKELREMEYRMTPAGRAERNWQWMAWEKASGDSAFQAFLTKIPALAEPPRRGRKTKKAQEASDE